MDGTALVGPKCTFRLMTLLGVVEVDSRSAVGDHARLPLIDIPQNRPIQPTQNPHCAH